jgi:hypothetical protein
MGGYITRLVTDLSPSLLHRTPILLLLIINNNTRITMSIPTVVAIRCKVQPSTSLLHHTHILFTHHQQSYPSHHVSTDSSGDPV